MSSVELREAVFAWPRCARSLLIVRAPISLARFVDAPELRSLSTMCSYLRSCLSVHSRRGIAATSLHDRLLGVRPHGCDDAGSLVESRAALDEILDAMDEVRVLAVQPGGTDHARGELGLVSQLPKPLLLPILHPRLFGRLGLRRDHASRLGVAWGSKTHLTRRV